MKQLAKGRRRTAALRGRASALSVLAVLLAAPSQLGCGHERYLVRSSPCLPDPPQLVTVELLADPEFMVYGKRLGRTATQEVAGGVAAGVVGAQTAAGAAAVAGAASTAAAAGAVVGPLAVVGVGLLMADLIRKSHQDREMADLLRRSSLSGFSLRRTLAEALRADLAASQGRAFSVVETAGKPRGAAATPDVELRFEQWGVFVGRPFATLRATMADPRTRETCWTQQFSAGFRSPRSLEQYQADPGLLRKDLGEIVQSLSGQVSAVLVYSKENAR